MTEPTIRINAVARPETDGSSTLVIEISGLNDDEAVAIGNKIADPIKIAVLQGVRARLTPSSYFIDSRNEERSEKRQQ